MDSGVVSSESQYQYGPDTYLLQLRDVDFPVRLRQYMKVYYQSVRLSVRPSVRPSVHASIPYIYQRPIN